MKAIGPMTRSAPTGAVHGENDADPALAEAFAALVTAALGTQPAGPPPAKAAAPGNKAAAPTGKAVVSVGKAVVPAGKTTASAGKITSGGGSGVPGGATSHLLTAVPAAVSATLPAALPAAMPAAIKGLPGNSAPVAKTTLAGPPAGSGGTSPAPTSTRPSPTQPPPSPSEGFLLPNQPAGPQEPFTRREGKAKSIDPAGTQAGLAMPTHATASRTPTAPPAPPPDTPPAAQPVPDQVVRLLAPLRVAADGDYTMSLQLRPAELGDVTVQVAVRDGVLSVVMQADDAAGHDALQGAMPDLHHALRSDGMRVGDVSLLPLTPPLAPATAQNGQSSHQFSQSGNQGGPELGQQNQPGQQGQHFGGNGQSSSGRHATTADLGSAGYLSLPNQPRSRDAGHTLPRPTAGPTVLDVDI